jgi:hypothetical protein
MRPVGGKLDFQFNLRQKQRQCHFVCHCMDKVNAHKETWRFLSVLYYLDYPEAHPAATE